MNYNGCLTDHEKELGCVASDIWPENTKVLVLKECEHTYGNLGGYDPLQSMDKQGYDEYKNDPYFDRFNYCPDCGMKL